MRRSKEIVGMRRAGLMIAALVFGVIGTGCFRHDGGSTGFLDEAHTSYSWVGVHLGFEEPNKVVLRVLSKRYGDKLIDMNASYQVCTKKFHVLDDKFNAVDEFVECENPSLV